MGSFFSKLTEVYEYWRPTFQSGIARCLSPRRTILAFGDSTTAARKERGLKRVYSQRLKSLLNAEGLNVKVINAGQGASHTGRNIEKPVSSPAHGLDRLEMVISHKPWIAIVQFGINDAWVDSGEPNMPSRISLESYVDNLNEMIDAFSREGVEIILMTPNRLGKRYAEWQQLRLQNYADASRAVAKNWNIKLVDVWKIFGDYAEGSNSCVDDLLLDAMHPNDIGHGLIAEALRDKIVASFLDNRTS